MSVSYFVRYDPATKLSEEFLQHYRTQHSKILRQFPGIEALYLHTAVTSKDGHAVSSGNTGLLAQMVFPSITTLDAALQSEARALARKDFERFPSHSAEITHQSMLTETIFTD